MTRMGYVFNCDTCLDIRSCQVACKVHHCTPAGINNTETYTSVDHSSYPDANEYFLPIICQQCDNPSCVKACKLGAIEKLDNGVVRIADADLCAACDTAACESACPYSGIHYDSVTRRAYKCDLCIDRVDQGLNPRCVDGCLTSSRMVGDFDDPYSAASQTIAAWKEAGEYVHQLDTSTGNGPNVYYLLTKKRWDDMRNLVTTQWHNPSE